MSRGRWNTIALGALVAFACEASFGFALWFAPGWANGWPLGLTIHTVWSTGMVVLLFLLSLTSAVSVGAAIGSVCARSEVGRRWDRPVFAAWLAVVAVAAFVLAYRAFPLIYSTTLEMWPNGYNPGRLNS